ncbi:class A beta-lactamase [Microbacteriaceae bacterium 4G12]
MLGAALLAALAGTALAGCGTGAASTGTPTQAPSSSAPAAEPAPEPSPTPAPVAIDVSAELAALEERYAARVGVSAVDTGTGRVVAFRAEERFAYASTLKVFVAAEFLRRVPVAERDSVVTWTQADVDAAGYSPVAGAHVAEGLPLAALAEAAVRSSDNAATNILLDRLGGPAALDAGLEELGDTTSEVVHDEPALNRVAPGATADTTTPLAFTANLRALLLGDALAAADRRILTEWMSGNATGDALIRAGAPEGWAVADKSGGAGGTRNDIAVVTPPGRDPILVTVLTTKADASAAYEDRLVAETAAVVLAALS